MRPVSGVGKYGDFIMYSPHNTAVPDGAVLVIRSGGPGLFDKEKLQILGLTPHGQKICLLMKV